MSGPRILGRDLPRSLLPFGRRPEDRDTYRKNLDGGDTRGLVGGTRTNGLGRRVWSPGRVQKRNTETEAGGEILWTTRCDEEELSRISRRERSVSHGIEWGRYVRVIDLLDSL